ncbi:Ni/Fe-hydrogenase, b-type cytochrome subunit [Pararhodospirillum photometricum]|uniref:Probable Ni/Fe-hydrogenase B-type cytochrome subunit n=1 Tax=Pararhodospirillum photometricum DSM 122 TaxID=1150469 RepID=H6SN24_PARPM|nr:Ni/Fe-hydrogenase, b-type cytochrome subunit [Pararhodospirillum photometricum]CCG06900.1 Nickel-dependent hydrogenase b-type cytochrome subunit [Pararhodospirillum photometricum DSM 122]
MSLETNEATPDLMAGVRRNASVYIYEAPVRLWHWVNAACVVILALTGYVMGNPPISLHGEASDSFVFGFIRAIHFSAAYVFAIFFFFRVYWAFVGNKYARQIFVLPVWQKSFWVEVRIELEWYLFLRKYPKKYMGHNPMAHIIMFFLTTLLSLFMIFTGFALYSQGTGNESWQAAVFQWVFLIFPNSQDVHMIHRMGMWLFIVYSIAHIYAALREDIMSRQSMLSTMISGRRMFKDDLP